MLSFLRCCLLFFALNLLADVNYTDPTTTTGDEGTPNLSQSTEDADAPQIATNSTGQYVYVIWSRSNGTNTIIQTVRSDDYGVSWENPTTVTGDGGTPNLSNDTQNAETPQITTNSTGQYVYAIWRRYDNANYIIQTARSEDYGISWENPTTVTGDGGTPNLSDNGQDTLIPQITTDSTGQYVYAIWISGTTISGTVQTVKSNDYGRNWENPTTVPGGLTPPNLTPTTRNDAPQITTNSTGEYVYAIWGASELSRYIKVAISSDSGITWANPTTVTGNTPPNLSGTLCNRPQIVTSSNGQYVYAIWERSFVGTIRIQTVRSDDSGVSWENPTTTTQGSPDLSEGTNNAQQSQIATDDRGKYIYAVWIRNDGSGNNITQTVRSDDYGITWENPTTVTGDPPNNLSTVGSNTPQIKTNSTGRYVYAIWTASNTFSRTAQSSDYGITWENPTTVTGTPPNTLSVSGQQATQTQIALSSTGRYPYVTWKRSNGTNTIIQLATGFNTEVVTSLSLSGSQIKVRFPFEIELQNKLTWDTISIATEYKIYTDANLTSLLEQVQAPNTSYTAHRIKNGDYHTYYVTWVDSFGEESTATQITLP